MPPLEVRVLPVGRLRPAAYNPRKPLAPDSPAYHKLRASVEAFGLVEPLVWNETSGRLVGGHARLRILNDLGITEVPVSVVRLDPAREKALNVVLNNQKAQGRYDPVRLAELLTELDRVGELTTTGFDRHALAALRLEPAERPVAEPSGDPDRVAVTLETDAATYDRLAPDLDQMVQVYDLVAHVRRG